MTTVAVTGASGILGRAVCARLESAGSVEEVIGTARRPFDPAEHGLTKMRFRSADITGPQAIEEAVRGADVVCHLAFTVLARRGDSERVRRINVDGTMLVCDAAARTGARRIVHASSVAAYGAHADNPVPITESHPVRGMTGQYYSEHKAEVEHRLDHFEAGNPGVEVVRIRPCAVVGPNSVDLFRGRVPLPVMGLLLSPALPWPFPDLRSSPFQLVHEDDVAEVFTLAITRAGARGAYNLAGAGAITLRDLAAELGKIPVPVPRSLARRLVDITHAAGVMPASGAWLDFLAFPTVMDTTRARTELGWIPRYDTRTALRAMLRSYRERSPFGRLPRLPLSR